MQARGGWAAPRCRRIRARGPRLASSRRLRQFLREADRRAEEIADRVEARGHVDHREGVRATERCDLVPSERGRDRSAPDRANAVRTRRRLRTRVLQVVDVDPASLRLAELERDELRQPLSRELADAQGERAALLERVPPRDGNEHVDPARTGGLWKADHAEIVEARLADKRD